MGFEASGRCAIFKDTLALKRIFIDRCVFGNLSSDKPQPATRTSFWNFTIFTAQGKLSQSRRTVWNLWFGLPRETQAPPTLKLCHLLLLHRPHAFCPSALWLLAAGAGVISFLLHLGQECLPVYRFCIGFHLANGEFLKHQPYQSSMLGGIGKVLVIKGPRQDL